MNIRRIQVGETELFKQIRLASLQEAPYAFSSTYESALQRSADSWREQVEHSAQGNDRATFIAFSDDLPIGIAALYRLEGQADVGEVLQVWVRPEYRGTNVARQLMDTVFQWARENNFRRILAGVTEGNVRAKAFYASYGFSVMEAHPSSDSDAAYFLKEVQ